MIILFLSVLLIDFDCTNRGPSSEKSHHILLTNLALGGLIILLFISQIKKRRP